jgi:regulator of PEP synthase PpsR (kinase-PPPase family)
VAEGKKTNLANRRPLIVVSGGFGISGEQLARTALAQFSDVEVPIVVVPHIRVVEEIENVVNQASACSATILHTLVDGHLRSKLIETARSRNVVAIDLMGPLLSHLSQVLSLEPAGQPGLYHKLREDYFSRVEAIEFAVAHDDGKGAGSLNQAEIVLLGPSRVGKTPLSMYLSVRGWKVANVPLVKGIPPPEELFQVDRKRVVGLILDPGQLVAHRQRRQGRLGLLSNSEYLDPFKIQQEIEEAERIYRRGGFRVVNTTDRPIEESAEAIIRRIKHHQDSPAPDRGDRATE